MQAPAPRLWLRLLSGPGAEPHTLSAQERRWCASLPAGRRELYAASRSLLRCCLAGPLGLDPEAVPLSSPPAAPPRLADGLGYVSLSHSRGHGLLAWSPAPIGVDLEWSQRSLPAVALARRFFPAAEAAWLQALPPADQNRALLESWVRKEAAIKWQGSSLALDLRHWCWDAERRELRHLLHGWRPAVMGRWHQGWLCAAVGDHVDRAIWS
jgi:phosphopantetheinyl transferase